MIPENHEWQCALEAIEVDLDLTTLEVFMHAYRLYYGLDRLSLQQVAHFEESYRGYLSTVENVPPAVPGYVRWFVYNYEDQRVLLKGELLA